MEIFCIRCGCERVIIFIKSKKCESEFQVRIFLWPNLSHDFHHRQFLYCFLIFVAMHNSFGLHLNQLKRFMYRFELNTLATKQKYLGLLAQEHWSTPKQLLAYHEVLLFMAAYPEHAEQLRIVEQELNRISTVLHKMKPNDKIPFQDSGLPYCNIITSFSHDLTEWISHLEQCQISIDSYDATAIDLNTLLKLTLPLVEHEETAAGLSNDALLETLKVKKKNRLQFILNEFGKLQNTPLIKDHLWASLKMFVSIEGKDKYFSRTFNCIQTAPIYFHQSLLKQFDAKALLDAPLPPPKKLNKSELTNLNEVIKKSLLFLLRETDPATYLQPESLRYYELERGISIAIYGMIPERQMAFQSYIGYTLFKNGYPSAYGGSWVFGRTAMFGLNIFETYRGGESGYIMCQLLRVYRQAFGIDYFEIEPYQYGKDNEEGIKTGAFWFYYKFGFRPTDSELADLAAKEYHKIKTKPGYRTKEDTLLRFTESTIAWQVSGKKPMKITALTGKITTMFAKKFKDDRSLAVSFCKQEFLKKTKNFKIKNNQKQVIEEISLLTEAMQVTDEKRLNLLQKMIETKPKDPYQYNRYLIGFLEKR